MTSQDYSKEILSWIYKFYRSCKTEEFRIVRTAIFTYHCSCLSLAIQKLMDSSKPDLLLAVYPSILHRANNVKDETAPLSNDESIRDCAIDPPMAIPIPPLPNSIRNSGLRVYQITFWLQLSMQVYKLLSLALQEASCTPEQHWHILEAQTRCIKEFQALADEVLFILAAIIRYNAVKSFIPACGSDVGGQPYTLGLWDIFRILGPARLLSLSPLSSDWERNMASTMLKKVHLEVRSL